MCKIRNSAKVVASSVVFRETQLALYVICLLIESSTLVRKWACPNTNPKRLSIKDGHSQGEDGFVQCGRFFG